MESMKIFEHKFHEVINNSVQRVLLENNENVDNLIPKKEDWCTKNESNLTCSYCRVEFSDTSQQRDHYKLDWHRYNLKQSLISKLPITEEEFDEKTGKDDLSSISGSDSEKEDTLDTYATAQGKIFLQSDKQQCFSLYRCLLFDRKEELPDDQTLLSRLKNCCVDNKQWAVLMLGGGHFAGAIFQGEEAILHKTFHCYTVRAGQGGSQSSRDSKSGGSQPKSAGASLRRYNEQALVQHVKSIVDLWRPEIAKSSLIFYRASGPYNRSVLFGGNSPLLDRSDSRLRTIPFSTRRATFTELKRVHAILSVAQVYSSVQEATKQFSKEKSPENAQKRNKAKSSCINRAKSRENIERPLPGTAHLSNSSSEVDLKQLNKFTISDSEESEGDIFELSSNDVEINLGNLEQYGDSLTPEQRKKTTKKKKPKKSKAKKQREQEEKRKKELLEILFKGDIRKLDELLQKHLQDGLEINEEENEDAKAVEKDSTKLKTEFMNEILDTNGNSLLHVAAMNEHVDLLLFLLQNDADPCVKNKKQETAYTCTHSKEIRESLKQYARENPDKYNYNKANIPLNALTNEEQSEKKKAQRKVKREKDKEKKKENAIKRQEQEEQNRFLQLSDREKRALAAERRILNQSGTVIVRCFLCASDMSGKVPFEYLGNRFCTIDCLKAHRMKNPTILS